jgi:hypothetical protein
MATLAHHRRQQAVLAGFSDPRGRLSRSPSTSRSSEARRQATLLRSVSIVEAFVSAELVRRFEPHAPPPRTEILDDVYTRAENDAIGSWPRMVERYKRWFNIRLTRTACPHWRQLEAAKDARNVIAHGLGELTRRQARKDQEELAKDFATVNISIVGNTLDIPEYAVRSVTFVCRDFIVWLDAELSRYDANCTVAPASI